MRGTDVPTGCFFISQRAVRERRNVMFLSLAREAREMCAFRMLLRHTADGIFRTRRAPFVFDAFRHTGLLTP